MAFSSGQRIFVPSLTLFVLKRQTPPSRFAIVCNKAVSPQASKRNRSKRLIRQSIMRLQNLLHSPIDMVIILKKTMADMSQSEVEGIIKQEFERVHLLK